MRAYENWLGWRVFLYKIFEAALISEPKSNQIFFPYSKPCKNWQHMGCLSIGNVNVNKLRLDGSLLRSNFWFQLSYNDFVLYSLPQKQTWPWKTARVNTFYKPVKTSFVYRQKNPFQQKNWKKHSLFDLFWPFLAFLATFIQ